MTIKTLSQYIKHKGIAAFVEQYGVKKRTAVSWQQKERRPRPERANELVKLSNGELSLEIIFTTEPTQ